jgi:hypothetical protein
VCEIHKHTVNFIPRQETSEGGVEHYPQVTSYWHLLLRLRLAAPCPPGPVLGQRPVQSHRAASAEAGSPWPSDPVLGQRQVQPDLRVQCYD